MLEHEPQETPAPQTFTAQIPAAERRVSAEELTRAVSALEDAKAAERVAGVAPIGQVVDELGLDSTPEEIWAQIQKQRAQKAAEEQAKQTHVMVPPAAVFQAPPRPRRRRRWWAAAGVVLIVWSVSHNAAMQMVIPHSGSTIMITGDRNKETIPVQGKDVVITGDNNKVILQGKARSVTIAGDHDSVSGQKPEAVIITGDYDAPQWTTATSPQLSRKPPTNPSETK